MSNINIDNENLDSQLHKAIAAALANGYSAEDIADTFTTSLNQIEQERIEKEKLARNVDITEAVQSITAAYQFDKEDECGYDLIHVIDLFMYKLRAELPDSDYDEIFAEYTENREEYIEFFNEYIEKLKNTLTFITKTSKLMGLDYSKSAFNDLFSL